MSRESDAIAISNGACNPIAIAKTIHASMVVMSLNKMDHNAIRNDPAIQLMVHQLNFLVVPDSMMSLVHYSKCIRDCEAKIEAEKSIPIAGKKG